MNGDQVDIVAEVRGNDAPERAREPRPGKVIVVDGVEFVYRDANDCGSADPIAAVELCRNDVSFTFTGTDIPWQPITVADIASFRPTPPRVAGEPDGWAVVGLPANLVANAPQEVVSGVLLGEPAEVRFTPVAYGWSYGDGTARTLTTPGSDWAALGLAQFTPTATSHVYAERGAVTVQLTVTYRAEYRFVAPGWAPVVGELRVSTQPVRLQVVTAATMLVDRECGSGPGC